MRFPILFNIFFPLGLLGIVNGATSTLSDTNSVRSSSVDSSRRGSVGSVATYQHEYDDTYTEIDHEHDSKENLQSIGTVRGRPASLHSKSSFGSIKGQSQQSVLAVNNDQAFPPAAEPHDHSNKLHNKPPPYPLASVTASSSSARLNPSLAISEFQAVLESGNLNSISVFVHDNIEVCSSSAFVHKIVSDNHAFDVATVACKIPGGEKLLEQIIKLNPEVVKAVNTISRGSLLHIAAFFNQKESVALLLKQPGVNTMARDIGGKIPLSSAIFSGNIEIFKMILDKIPDKPALKKYQDEFGDKLERQARKNKQILSIIQNL